MAFLAQNEIHFFFCSLKRRKRYYIMNGILDFLFSTCHAIGRDCSSTHTHTVRCVACCFFLLNRLSMQRRAGECAELNTAQLSSVLALEFVQFSFDGVVVLDSPRQGLRGLGRRATLEREQLVLDRVAALERRELARDDVPTQLAGRLGLRLQRHHLLLHPLKGCERALSIHAAGEIGQGARGLGTLGPRLQGVLLTLRLHHLAL
mmetsp:Transcript_1640/g.4662  ORF Transcript_1640/g.4662 Transcript_1640/m.4662 type:complete len:205 (+) Transcript_1640:1581-2195(+)